MQTQPALPGGAPSRRTPYVRWSFYLLWACLLLLLVLVAGLILLALRDGDDAGERTRSLSPEARRELAGKLLAAGLPEQAAEQYEIYLAEADLPPERRANIAYTLGKTYLESGSYERALSWLYRVELFAPDTALAPEAGSKIVACLEHLGRLAQAEYSLASRSRADRPEEGAPQGERIVARIGEEPVTLRDLNAAIEALPPWLRKSLDDPGQREAYLRQYVAEELLARKARKLELHKDPAVRAQADRALRSILIQRVLEDEVRDRVQVSDADVELYFEAHRADYDRGEAYRIQTLAFPAEHAEAVRAAREDGADFRELVERYTAGNPEAKARAERTSEWIEAGLDPTGMGNPERLWRALHGLRKEEVSAPVEADGTGYLFRVVDRRPARRATLDEVRDRVEQDLTRARVERATQDLIRQTLEVSDVELFPDVLQEDD